MKRTILRRGNVQLKRSPLRKKSKTKDTITVLHDKARQIFAKFIIKRDKGICFTCGKPGNQAGHFIHGKSMDFSEKGNHCQCVACNYFRGGNLIVYAINLEKKYGYGIVQKLRKEADKNKKWKVKELIGLTTYYKKKLNMLK